MQDDLSVEMGAKVYLQNRLGKCRAKLDEIGPIIQSKGTDSHLLFHLSCSIRLFAHQRER